MGEHVFKVALTELLMVRIKCKNPECRAVTELPLDNLELADDGCPVCKAGFTLGPQDTLHGPKRLKAFKEAVKNMLMMAGHYDVEFPINLDARAGSSATKGD